MSIEVPKDPGVNPLEASPNPNIPAKIDVRLVVAPNEVAAREKLLQGVRVDKDGWAHCVNPLTQRDSFVVAVRVDDDRNATLVPLILSEEGELQLPLPADKPSRIGFFIGSTVRGASTVLRNGEYPGEALTTEVITDTRSREVPYNLSGIRVGIEQNEMKWGEQVGIEADLQTQGQALTTYPIRGVFNRSTKQLGSDNWQDSPLLVVPTTLEDMIIHHDPNQVETDKYQVLVYGAAPMPDDFPLNYRGGATRGGMIGGYSPQSEIRNSPLQAGSRGSLEGAFKIKVTAQKTS